MQGFAQKLFKAKVGREISSAIHEKSAWPIIERYLAKKQLAYVDYALAKKLIPYSNQHQPIAALVCHLSAAARQGNLCVKIAKDDIQPQPHQIWISNESELSENENYRDLIELLKKVSEESSQDLISTPTRKDLAFPNKALCKRENLYYLQKNWVYESLFIHHWHELEKSNPEISFNQEQLNSKLEIILTDKFLLPEQAEAIRKAAKNRLSMIIGGPGTGKTYTAGHLITLFYETMNEKEKKNCTIALAAPTGKAAANLQKSLMRALGNSQIKIPKATTLHALLGLRQGRSGYDEQWNPQILAADIILVDECSMIDVKMMAYLFASVKPGARLILMGDPYQLPPVESGNLFADLVAKDPQAKNISSLTKCLRTESQEIVSIAQAINCGDADLTLALLMESGAFFALNNEKDSIKKRQQEMVSYCEKYYDQEVDLLTEPQKLLEKYNRFRLLTPMRQGAFGVQELNQLFYHNAIAKRKSGALVIPIIITRNDARLGLFNGESGLLISHRSGGENGIQEGDYALFFGEEQVRKIPALLLPRYEWGYCLSVHKSQGSEFERVMLLMPKGSEIFGREALYTGVTRAKKHLEIWSTEETLQNTIKQQTKRMSGI